MGDRHDWYFAKRTRSVTNSRFREDLARYDLQNLGLVLSGMRCARRQVRGRDVVLKISEDWNVSDCIRISCGGAWCITKRYYPVHRRQHHCCHSDDWQEQHAVPRNRTATVRAAHAACIARTGVMPRGLYTGAASAQTPRLASRRTRDRVLGRPVASVAFNCDPRAYFRSRRA